MASYCPKSDSATHSEPQPANLYLRLHSQLISSSPYSIKITLTHTPSNRRKLKRQD